MPSALIRTSAAPFVIATPAEPTVSERPTFVAETVIAPVVALRVSEKLPVSTTLAMPSVMFVPLKVATPSATSSSVPANCVAPVWLNLTRTTPETVTPGTPTTCTTPIALSAYLLVAGSL